MVHLAANMFTSPDAYILFNSHLASYNYDLIGKNKFFTPRPSVLDFVGQATVAKQGMDLAEDRTDEQIIWLNNCVNVLMSEDLISEKQRKNPKEMKRFENKLKGCANLLKYWSTGDGRPENGCYVGFNSEHYKSGKVTLPKYY